MGIVVPSVDGGDCGAYPQTMAPTMSATPMIGGIVIAWFVLLTGCASEPPTASADAAVEGSVDADADLVAFPGCFLSQCDGGKQYCPPDVVCSPNGSDCSWCTCKYNSISNTYSMGCSGPCAGNCPMVDAGDQ